MRVFHLIKGLGRGGAERLLVDGLRTREPGMTHGYGYFLPHKDALVAELRGLGADVECFRSRGSIGMLASTGRVAAFLRRWAPDVLHCHLPLAGVVGRLAAVASRTPVVYTEHNVLESYHRATLAANLATWRLQAGVVAVSGLVADSIRRHAGGRVPLRVVRNGVALDRLKPVQDRGADLRARLGIAQDAPVVGTVAVFRASKALDRWLRAARLVRERVPGCRFVVVGDGPLRADLERLTSELGLKDAVCFPGLQEDVSPFLAVMDVFVMSSVFEGLPIALLEAMAMEVPVVVPRVGGIPEAVEDGRDGVLLDITELRLAEAIRSLLADPAERARLGAAARRRVHRDFSMERMNGELSELYRSVTRARVGV